LFFILKKFYLHLGLKYKKKPFFIDFKHLIKLSLFYFIKLNLNGNFFLDLKFNLLNFIKFNKKYFINDNYFEYLDYEYKK